MTARASLLLIFACLIHQLAAAQDGIEKEQEGSTSATTKETSTEENLPRVSFPLADPNQNAVVAEHGDGILPNEHGQIWREFDISSYTNRITDIDQPQQAIIDWVLRETGTDIWFSEPFGLLCASRTALRVYHTPPAVDLVEASLDRFLVNAKELAFNVRLVSVKSPDWRNQAQELLRTVHVQTPGVNAFLLSKENAALLMMDLRKREGFSELNRGRHKIKIVNGQSTTISMTRDRNYVAEVDDSFYAQHQALMRSFPEGWSFFFSPLMSQDSNVVDAVVKLHIDQLERLVPTRIKVRGFREDWVEVSVPQVASYRIHERFRWPSDHVLLLDLGIIPIRSLPLAKNSSSKEALTRASTLLFIEYKGKANRVFAKRSVTLPPYYAPAATRTIISSPVNPR